MQDLSLCYYYLYYCYYYYRYSYESCGYYRHHRTVTDTPIQNASIRFYLKYSTPTDGIYAGGISAHVVNTTMIVFYLLDQMEHVYYQFLLCYFSPSPCQSQSRDERSVDHYHHK